MWKSPRRFSRSTLMTLLCWLMNNHAVSADRVVNIDETSGRLLPVQTVGWGRHGVKQAQVQGNTREATTFTVLQLQELHPDAGDHDAGPLRPQRHLRRRVREQGMARTVFGRLGVARHDLLQQKPVVEDWMSSIARSQRRRFPQCRDGGRSTPCPR